ncbi:biotin transporter BioY [Diaminobutyricimonas sp. LJ205]|uniref:biotin transporter BioY n=1 Tax=Diaminobutyricimonas sp. LJ205 TaxID=2683590 RepID=UPI0012F48F1C|nr:biotin transporter BioY [Diaminobutyricimonas sp. LJ205]
MSTAITHPSQTLVGGALVGRSQRWAVEIGVVASGVVLVALLAKVSIFLGPVPLSGQTLGVLLVGAAFGAARGAVTMFFYAVLGLAGLPIFAGPGAGLGYLLSPSFGFILGFIPCAWIVGRLAERGWDRTFGRGIFANTVASIVPFALGVPYMAAILALGGQAPSFVQAMEWGVLPFLPGGVLKAIIAALALPLAWSVHRRLARFNERSEGGRS